MHGLLWVITLIAPTVRLMIYIARKIFYENVINHTTRLKHIRVRFYRIRYKKEAVFSRDFDFI